MSVQEYLDKHMLSRKIEDAVNAAVRAKTPDPVLFISNHMRKAVPSVITKVKARQILDCRGIPTVEVDLYTNKGMFRASAPSGAPSGLYEAIELRDGDKGTYLGNGVTRAVRNVNEKISEAIVGMDPTLQNQIDQAMIDLDKTEKKGELGGNAILAVSMAACKAGAAEKEVPLYKHIADLSGRGNHVLPVPAFTLISGGKHAANNLAIRDIMILPIGAKRFEEAMQMGSETYHHLKAVITEKYGAQGCNVGEDGGFSPNVSSFREGLDLVKEAINRTGYNGKIKIAIDVAATDFCIGTKYDLDYKSPNRSGQNFKSGEDMVEMYKELCKEYPIVSIEDPFDMEDWEQAKYFTGLGICQVADPDAQNTTQNATFHKNFLATQMCQEQGVDTSFGINTTGVHNPGVDTQFDYISFDMPRGFEQNCNDGVYGMWGEDALPQIATYLPNICPPPSAFLGPKCALWDCPRPAQGWCSERAVQWWCTNYCSGLHATIAQNEGQPGMTPVIRPKGIELKDNLLFAALCAKAQGKTVGVPECEGAATAKSPWNAPELFDLSVFEGETLREWLFFDKPRRAFESGNRKQRSLPDYNGRGWHESRKQVINESGWLKRSYYMDPQPMKFLEWHLYEYEINKYDTCALYRLELKLVDKKKSPKGKIANESVINLQKQMGRLKGRGKGCATVYPDLSQTKRTLDGEYGGNTGFNYLIEDLGGYYLT